jgi:hypothetical protein
LGDAQAVAEPPDRFQVGAVTVGIDSLLALIAFGTLGFLWAVLPNADLSSEASKEVPQ